MKICVCEYKEISCSYSCSAANRSILFLHDKFFSFIACNSENDDVFDLTMTQ